ncbi:hypothetical protein PV08_11876 [Exophiala spinifera]|uniref:Uncharacterized protein n=1 Tax=Exophiala spinifera TaxID=91928 RepID=A0A0D1Y493_9EURO|nr:uncharacterized protein PV08_11876 [Exophiala spinifera]KIW09776.1 hypothetical protein PV08_11876 [Exophiala spinifera]
MIRHSIKKRWQKLGVWNSKWGVPTGELGGFGNNDGPKSWEWESLSQARESAESRAIRLHLQRQGRENENLTPQLQEVGDTPDIQVDDRESLITSRPWFLWALEVAEEAVRLQRNPKQSKIEAYEPAPGVIICLEIGWMDGATCLVGSGKMSHHRQNPPDPDEMEFTPSEIDASEAIRPSTPQPQPKSAHPERRPPSPTAHPVRSLFWNSLNAASPCSTEPTANSLTDNEIYAESAQPLLQDYAETPSRTEQRPQSSPATLRKQQRRHTTHRHLTGSNTRVTRSTRLVEVPKKPTRKQRTSQAPTSETSKLAPLPRRSPRIAKRDRHQKDAAAQSDAVKASAIAKVIQQSQLDEDIEETLSCAKRTKNGQLKQRHPRKSSTPLGATKRMARSRNVNA